MNLELCSWQSPSYLALSTGSWRLPEEPRRRRGIPLDSKASLDSLWLFRRLQLSSLPALTPWSPAKPSSWPWGTAAVHKRARFLGARRATCLYYSRQVPPVVLHVQAFDSMTEKNKLWPDSCCIFHHGLICWRSCKWVARFSSRFHFEIHHRLSSNGWDIISKGRSL